MKKALVITFIALLVGALGLVVLAQGTPAAKAPAAAKSSASKVEKAYVCAMCDFAGDKAGKCPKCGMTLKEVNKSDIYYSCACKTKDGKPATCCKTTSDKPGKCKCDVDMKMHVKGDEKPAKS
jgi:hypothetical protein